jgi:alpha 1,3-mannosyltransferase
LASSFQQAILMDADTVFLQAPEVLFSQPTYLEKGALFFQDRTLFSVSGEVTMFSDVLTKTESSSRFAMDRSNDSKAI